MRNGDFSEPPSQIDDPSSTVPDPNNAGQYTRTPFSGNQIPSNRRNAITQQYLQYYPLPNAAGAVNNFNWTQAISTNDAQGTVRVDHYVNERNRLFGRWRVTDDSYSNGDWVNGISAWSQYVRANTFV